MKKTKIMLALLAPMMLASCGGSSGGGSVEFDYIHLQNNNTGFTTSDGDTAIAIGLKKNSALTTQINDYLNTLNADYWDSLMNKMAALTNDSKATYEIEYTVGDNSNGVFKVGMECAYEPYNWTQNNNKNGAVSIANVPGKYANGYDVQIAAQVAAALNMKLEVYQYEWDALIPAVQSGTLTAICAGMSPTDDRKEAIDFSANYYQSNLVVITQKDSELLACTSLADIDKAGVKIAAQPGTFHLDALQKQTKNLTVISNLNDFVNMRIALEAGTIDGYIAEEPTALALCN